VNFDRGVGFTSIIQSSKAKIAIVPLESKAMQSPRIDGLAAQAVYLGGARMFCARIEQIATSCHKRTEYGERWLSAFGVYWNQAKRETARLYQWRSQEVN
jgi:hypothetical protein